jgi:rod shape-determining protein MreD
MNRHLLAILLLLSLTLGFQVALSMLSDKMTVAQPVLALAVVLCLRAGRVKGTLAGAALGALADALQASPIGFHGISYSLIGYALSWLGGKVIIRSVNPVVLLSLVAFLVDVGCVALLHALLGLNLARSLWWWVLPGCLFTGFMAVVLELAARKLLPREKGDSGP